MTEVLTKLKNIRDVQQTIDTLLSSQKVVVDGGKCINTWSIEEVYTGKDCNFGFAYSDIDGKSTFPLHIHADSIEYLICVKGSVRLTIADKVTRILNTGDCASIPPGSLHTTTPLEPASKLVYVCIPPDGTFPQRKVR